MIAMEPKGRADHRVIQASPHNNSCGDTPGRQTMHLVCPSLNPGRLTSALTSPVAAGSLNSALLQGKVTSTPLVAPGCVCSGRQAVSVMVRLEGWRGSQAEKLWCSMSPPLPEST